MKRDYHSHTEKENLQEGVTYFQGVEIEHTPAFGMNTLFVVGILSEIEAIADAADQGYGQPLQETYDSSPKPSKKLL